MAAPATTAATFHATSTAPVVLAQRPASVNRRGGTRRRYELSHQGKENPTDLVSRREWIEDFRPAGADPLEKTLARS